MKLVMFALLVGTTGCDALWGLQRVKPDMSMPTDAAAPRTCDHGSAFPTGRPVPIVGTYGVEGARFTPNESLAYLSLCPGDKTTCDLFTGMFTPDGKLGGFNTLSAPTATNVYDSYPTVSRDLDYLVFGSARAGGVHLFVGTAVNGNLGQATVKQPTVTAALGNTNEPYLVSDTTLYFAGTANLSTNDWNIYRASGSLPDFGTTPALVTSVSSTQLEFAPVVSDDELEIWFSSNRATPTDVYALDIFTASRTSPDADFSTATRVDTLSTSGIDWPLWISPNGCRLYYINKPSNTGMGVLYVTDR